MGLPARKLSHKAPSRQTRWPLYVDTIKKGLAKGLTYQAIGDQLRMTRERVRQIIHLAGLDHTTGQKIRAAQREEVRYRKLRPTFLAVLDHLRSLGHEVEMIQKAGRGGIKTHQFLINGEEYCFHEAIAKPYPNYWYEDGSPGNKYYHVHRCFRAGWQVIVTPIGNFILGPNDYPPFKEKVRGLYIREDGEGMFARFRENWPWLRFA